MRTFEEYLTINEGRYQGVLYHITSYIALIDILKSDMIKVGSTGAVSFTRNKNFLTKPSGSIILSGVGVMISLNAEKLTNRYKIEPYNYHGLDVQVGDEMEERVLSKNINSVKKMITDITLFGTYFPDDQRGQTILKRRMGLGIDDQISLSSYSTFIENEYGIKCKIIP